MLKRLMTHKSYQLVAFSVILLVLAYQLAFQKTILLWKENRQLQGQVSENAGLAYQPGYLIRKNNNLNHVLDQYRVDTSGYRNSLVNAVSLLAAQNNARLSEVPADNPDLHQARASMQQLRLEGDYFALIRVWQGFHHLKKMGMLRSVDLHVKKDRSGPVNPKILLMDVYFEIVN